MLRGANIVVLASIDWAFNRQNPQEVASAFAESGNRVLFVENTGVRSVGLRDLPRLAARLRNWWHARGGVDHAPGGVDVLSPLLLPFPYARAAAAMNTRLLMRAIRKWLRGATTGGPLIVVTFLPTPLARGVIRALAPALVVYYCIDRLAKSSPGARRLIESEPKLLAEADLVLVTSSGLFELARGARRVEMLQSGVRIEAFEEALARRGEPHPAFAGQRRPVVGFVGSLRDATDLALLQEAAALAPDLDFVLVGPSFADLAALRALPNVRLAGAVPHGEVMSYMVRFDAGVLPYVQNPFTSNIMPVKLKEYLAAGLPVVATPLPEVQRFANEHPGLIAFASDAQTMVNQLREQMAHNTAQEVARRIDVARGYQWKAQMARMSELIESALQRLSSS
jgi:glycosyltransferase involved in cell wall biosynthesis